jgi:F0F1-type ATP synthase membrane subunit b/b'
MFLLPDGTMWVQLANFAIFFAVLSVVFLRPVSRAIRERREYINSLSADYAKYQGEANALRAQAEGERASARRDAEAAIGKARAQASNESAQLSAQYAAKVQATVDAAHQTVASELDSARAGEAGLVAQLADLMVERTLGGGSR